MAFLFITHKFPPSIGGMQKQSYELINGIRKFEKVYSLLHAWLQYLVSIFLKFKNTIMEISLLDRTENQTIVIS